jgi:hypothetical protein
VFKSVSQCHALDWFQRWQDNSRNRVPPSPAYALNLTLQALYEAGDMERFDASQIAFYTGQSE